MWWLAYWLTHTSKPSSTLARYFPLSWAILWKNDEWHLSFHFRLRTFQPLPFVLVLQPRLQPYSYGARASARAFPQFSVNSALTSLFASSIGLEGTVSLKGPSGSGKLLSRLKYLAKQCYHTAVAIEDVRC